MKTKAQASPRASADYRPKGKVVGAVVNASKVLRFLRTNAAPATVTQITRAAAINPSTCFNILRTLIEEDLVHFDATAKTYQLGLGLVALARGSLDHSQELHVLKQRIEDLARRHRVTAAIHRKISDDRIVLVAAAESDAPVRIHARAGTRMPLLLGASGRVIAAHAGLSRAELKQRFSELRLVRPLDFETYLEQLDEARRLGWAIDDGYVFPGTVTCAAPVFGVGGTVEFSCSAILFNGQYDVQRVAAIAADLRQIGRTFLDEPGA